MNDEEIARLHHEHRRPGFGTLAIAELALVRDLIAEHRPRSFIEIGTASGLSAGMIARMLDEHGGERLVTVDYSPTFFADATRETGYLIPELYPAALDHSGRVEVVRLTSSTSTVVPGRGELYEMGFVDANHEHPWPLIDTLCLYPVLRGPKILFQDDLNLYQKQPIGRSVGPKFLFDQFPESHRERARARGGNLFRVSLDLPLADVERIAYDAFTIPWTLSHKLKDDTLVPFRRVLTEHYSSDLLAAFDSCCEKYNVPNGSYMRPRSKAAGGPGKA